MYYIYLNVFLLLKNGMSALDIVDGIIPNKDSKLLTQPAYWHSVGRMVAVSGSGCSRLGRPRVRNPIRIVARDPFYYTIEVWEWISNFIGAISSHSILMQLLIPDGIKVKPYILKGGPGRNASVGCS